MCIWLDGAKDVTLCGILSIYKLVTMRILIADDHTLFLEGLRLQLEAHDPSMQVQEAADFDTVFEQVRQTGPPDLVLIDLAMPGMDWRQALPLLRKHCPDAPVVVVSASDARDDILAALNCGAAGYIPKSSPGKVMLRALELVLSGGIYVPPEVLSWVERGGKPAATSETAAARSLTPRQIEVLSLMAKGQSNKMIARTLKLAEGTVKLHVAAILKALGVGNRAHAVLVAVQTGVLPGSRKTG
jgi:DNA-binding NarL/FixJ family response regulator